MSRPVTIKFQDAIVQKADILAPRTPMKNRNAYVNAAVDRLNRIIERETLSRELALASRMVREDNLSVVAEFEAVEGDVE